ncbi:MAG: sigma-70 family RNA polymerase sigma factor [Candidatus Omnitrophota bacterium]|jgi:RNA polymerase sigma factor (sigma-70 family)|nr:MAG: sigma-70 family RNA polymerase sigma factor [Candidatus Omnitrophota bacterium]
MNDLEFVQRCINDEKLAWVQFIEKYSRFIYSYIHGVLSIKNYHPNRDISGDIFQEIFIFLRKDNFKKLKSFKAKNGCSLSSWLKPVVANFTIDYLRRQKDYISIDEEVDPGLSIKEIISDNKPLADDEALLQEKLSTLEDCIELLDLDDKLFIELNINKGLALDEVRQLLSISRGAVDMRKSRIVQRLKECFKTKGFALES